MQCSQLRLYYGLDVYARCQLTVKISAPHWICGGRNSSTSFEELIEMSSATREVFCTDTHCQISIKSAWKVLKKMTLNEMKLSLVTWETSLMRDWRSSPQKSDELSGPMYWWVVRIWAIQDVGSFKIYWIASYGQLTGISNYCNDLSFWFNWRNGR